MSFAQFRSFSNSEINDAIARFSESRKALKINAQTVRKIGEKLLELRESTLSEAELINICVNQQLRPIGSSRKSAERHNVEPHPQLVDSYLAVVRDIMQHRTISNPGNYDAARCIRPSMQRSAATTA
jgi:hypothetical protein